MAAEKGPCQGVPSTRTLAPSGIRSSPARSTVGPAAEGGEESQTLCFTWFSETSYCSQAPSKPPKTRFGPAALAGEYPGI